MPNIGPVELVIILVIALLVIGPGKLPDVGSALGKSIREFRKAASDVQESVRLDTPPAAAPAAPAVPAAPAPPAPPAAPVPNALAAPATPNELAAPAPVLPPAPVPAAPAPVPAADPDPAAPAADRATEARV